jgi:hypothetical protein
MVKQGLKVCSVNAGLRGFRDRAANVARSAAAAASMDWARARGAELVVFPAGYLRANAAVPAEAQSAAAAIVEHAQRLRVGVVVGIDACAPTFRATDEKAIARGKLPHFVVAWAPAAAAVHTWQQRSTTAADAAQVPSERAVEVRALDLGGRVVGIVHSGEGFNPTVRERLAAANPVLAVMPAHVASGLRHWQALGWLRDHGVPVLRAVHAAAGAENVLWRRRGKTKSNGAGKEQPVEVEVFGSDGASLEVSLFSV